MKLPKIKKEISAFLLSEDGKISKEKLFKVGVVAAGVGIMTMNAPSAVAHGSGHSDHSNNYHSPCGSRSDTHSQHCQNISVQTQGDDAGTGTHSHGTHSSKHGSY